MRSVNRFGPLFVLHSIIAFSVALAGLLLGEVMLPVDPWARAFLVLGTIFLASATVTLTHCAQAARERRPETEPLNLDRLLAACAPAERVN